MEHRGDFYHLNCRHSFRTENKPKSYEKACKNKDFYEIVIPSQKDNILHFSQYTKSDKMLYIIYTDLEFLIKNRWMCKQSRKIFSNKNRKTYSLRIFSVNNLGI